MARSLHIRLDESSSAALQVVRASTTSDSDAVRTALREAAARRLSAIALSAEIAVLTADATDVAEMRAIRAEMDALRPEPDAR